MGVLVTSEQLDRIEETVTRVEEGTTAEIVVVIAGRSGSYKDLSIYGGAVAAAAALLLLIYLPLPFPEIVVLPVMLLAGAAGAVLCARSATLARLLSLEDRRQEQVSRAAKVAFVDEAVSGTRERTGVLVYYSMLEDLLEVLSDHGIDARIPRGTWNSLVATAVGAAGGEWPRSIEELLTRAQPVLAERFPAGEDDPDEIPNRPRVLP